MLTHRRSLPTARIGSGHDPIRLLAWTWSPLQNDGDPAGGGGSDPSPADPPKTDPWPDPKPADPKPDPADDDKTDWKAQSRKWEDRAKANASAAKELADLKAASATDTEKAIAAARAEQDAKANARILRSEIKAAAAALKFHDPADALGQVELAAFAPDEHGDFDSTAITAALKDVLKSKPYLGAPAGGQQGPGNPGFGTGGTPAGSAQDRANRLAEAQKAGDIKTTTALKVGQLFGGGPNT